MIYNIKNLVDHVTIPKTINYEYEPKVVITRSKIFSEATSLSFMKSANDKGHVTVDPNETVYLSSSYGFGAEGTYGFYVRLIAGTADLLPNLSFDIWNSKDSEGAYETSPESFDTISNDHDMLIEFHVPEGYDEGDATIISITNNNDTTISLSRPGQLIYTGERVIKQEVNSDKVQSSVLINYGFNTTEDTIKEEIKNINPDVDENNLSTVKLDDTDLDSSVYHMLGARVFAGYSPAVAMKSIEGKDVVLEGKQCGVLSTHFVSALALCQLGLSNDTYSIADSNGLHEVSAAEVLFANITLEKSRMEVKRDLTTFMTRLESSKDIGKDEILEMVIEIGETTNKADGVVNDFSSLKPEDVGSMYAKVDISDTSSGNQ